MYQFSRIILGFIVRILFRVRIYGRKNLIKPPYIIASNHASYLDPPILGLIGGMHPVSFMAKKELFDMPVIGAWFRMVRCIAVKRGENSIKSLKDALEVLKEKRAIALFPEGTRSEDGALQEAKRGVGFLISKSRVPVVPVYIEGTQQALPKKGKIKWGATVKAYVGRPILPEDFISEGINSREYARFSSSVMDNIAKIKSLHQAEDYRPS